MQDRFWWVLGVLPVAVIVGVASIGSRGAAKHGAAVSFGARVADLPNQLMDEFADMTPNLPEAMGQHTIHTTARCGPYSWRQDPGQADAAPCLC